MVQNGDSLGPPLWGHLPKSYKSITVKVRTGTVRIGSSAIQRSPGSASDDQMSMNGAFHKVRTSPPPWALQNPPNPLTLPVGKSTILCGILSKSTRVFLCRSTIGPNKSVQYQACAGLGLHRFYSQRQKRLITS